MFFSNLVRRRMYEAEDLRIIYRIAEIEVSKNVSEEKLRLKSSSFRDEEMAQLVKSIAALAADLHLVF
ncbi:hypothetical protein STEG23_006938 [Scotinomys teguina]